MHLCSAHLQTCTDSGLLNFKCTRATKPTCTIACSHSSPSLLLRLEPLGRSPVLSGALSVLSSCSDGAAFARGPFLFHLSGRLHGHLSCSCLFAEFYHSSVFSGKGLSIVGPSLAGGRNRVARLMHSCDTVSPWPVGMPVGRLRQYAEFHVAQGMSFWSFLCSESTASVGSSLGAFLANLNNHHSQWCFAE